MLPREMLRALFKLNWSYVLYVQLGMSERGFTDISRYFLSVLARCEHIRGQDVRSSAENLYKPAVNSLQMY